MVACGSPQPSAPARDTAPLGGSGLSAAYTAIDAEQVFVQTDPQIWFNWGRLSPAEGMRPGEFRAAWSGFVRPEFAEEYTFFLTASGQARLWVGGQEVATGSAVRLSVGQQIPVRLEYIRGRVEEPALKLEWQSPSVKREVIPAGRLYPQNPASGATAEVRKMTVATGQNLLVNPDFEAGTASWSGTFATATPGQGGAGQAASLGAFAWVQQNLTYQRVEGGYAYRVEAWGLGQGCTVGFTGSTFQGANFGQTLTFSNAAWERKTATLTMPANAAWAGVYLSSQGTACHFDNLNVSVGELPPIPPTPATNFIVNGGFESGAANWSNNLGIVSMVPGRTGANAGQITNWAWVQQNLPGSAVVGGQRYTLKGWGRTPNGATCTLGFSGGGTLGGQSVSFSTTVTFKDAAWQERGISLEVPEGVSWSAVYVTNNTESCQFDDLVVGQAVPGGSGATADSITVSSPVALAGSGFYLDGIGLGTPGSAFSWNFGDGTTGTGETVYKTFATPGLYTVTLTVTNAVAPASVGGVQATSTRTFTTQVGALPSIHEMPTYQGQVSRVINVLSPTDSRTFAFNVRFPQSGLDYRWAFSDGSSLTGPSVSKSFNPGFQDVTLTVRDNRGDSPTFGEVVLEEQTRVNVLVEPPFADIDQVSQNGTTITLNAGGSAGYGNLGYEWRFDDGTTASGYTVTKTFPANGHYGVTMTVRDQLGQTDVTDGNVLVGTSFDPQNPFARVRATYGGLQATSEGSLDPAASLSGKALRDFQRRTEPNAFYAEGVGGGRGVSAQAVTLTIPSDYPFVLHNQASDIRITQRVAGPTSRLLSSTASVALNGTAVARGASTWNVQGCETSNPDVCQTIETFRGLFPSTLFNGVNTVNLIARQQGASGETSFPTRFKVFHGLRVPRVLISVIPDSQYPFGGDVQTQEYTVTVGGRQELFLQVNVRAGAVNSSGFAYFRVPVYAVDGAGNHLPSVNGVFLGNFADTRITSAVSASSMVGGRALIETYVPFNAFNNGSTQFDLGQFRLASQGNCTANTFYQAIGYTLTGCSTIPTSYERPVNLTRPAYPYRLTADFTSRTNRIFVGRSVQQWSLYDKNLRDAFSSLDRLSPLGVGAQSASAMDLARLVIGFLPVIGDAVDGLEQVYNAATGRQVDPVIAALSTAGLALDLATGGAGDVTAIFKGVYRFSRDSAGSVAVVIRQQSDALFSGRVTPTAYVTALRNRLTKVFTLGTTPQCGLLGLDCLRLYDRVAKRYQVRGNLTAGGAVDRTDQVFDNPRYEVANSNPRNRVEDMDELTQPFCPLGSALGGQGKRLAPRNILCPSSPPVTDTVPVGGKTVTRIKEITFTVDPAKFNGGTDPSKSGKDFRNAFGSYDASGNLLDDAGHLISYVFGGRGTVDNIVPILARVNQFQISPFEKRLKAEAATKTVQVTIKLEYATAGTPLRPSKITYDYTVNGSSAALSPFTNPQVFDNPLQ